MDALKTLKTRLENRERVFMPTLSPEGAAFAGAYAAAGVDCALIDAEHAPVGIETLRGALRACREGGLPAVVRVPDALYASISKTLDAGADGIMVPRVESLSQAKTAVESSKFPPLGKKGCGGPGIFRPGESVSEFNENRVIFLQIESPAGIALLPELLEQYGAHTDGVVVGPSDLSISLGIPLETEHPLLKKEVRRVIGICAKADKSCGMYLSGMEEAGFWAGEGMNIIWTGDDKLFARIGAERAAAAVRRL